MRRSFRTALAAVALTAAATGTAAADASAARGFVTPSGNIVCEDSSRWKRSVTCFVASADVNYRITTYGRGHIGGAVHSWSHPTLSYGRSMRFGTIRCSSHRSGVLCKSRRSGHGFWVSRGQRDRF